MDQFRRHSLVPIIVGRWGHETSNIKLYILEGLSALSTPYPFSIGKKNGSENNAQCKIEGKLNPYEYEYTGFRPTVALVILTGSTP